MTDSPMATRTVEDLLLQGKAARAAARQVARLSTNAKNDVLLGLADSLQSDAAEVLAVNAGDYAAAQAEGLSESLLDRLLLTPDRLQAIAAELRKVASLPDPVGEAIDMKTLPNGMVAGRRRVPLGVVASIYESRPNVTVDIFGLCSSRATLPSCAAAKRPFAPTRPSLG